MVRLVLFDVDGTLVHTHGAGVRAFGRALASQFGVPDDTSFVSFGGRTDPGLVREFFLRYAIAPNRENFRLFFDCYVQWLGHLTTETTGAVCPGAWRLIRDLRNLRQPPVIGLLTGNIRLGAEIKLRRFGLWECFEMGAFGDDHEDRNEIAVIARQRGMRLLKSELRGEDIVVIGDTPADIRCGRAIGAKVLAVATGTPTLAQLRSHAPDWAVDDLEKIGAEEICGG